MEVNKMLIQAYSDGLCRVFKDNNSSSIFEFTVKPALKLEVDKRLKVIGWRRREKWRDYPASNFSEAKLRKI